MSDMAPEVLQTTIVGGRSRPFFQPLLDIIRERNLVMQFAVRQRLIRNRQTILGNLWHIINPVVSAGVFSIVLGLFVGVSGDGTPYPIFVFSGMLFWQYFMRSFTEGVSSLVGASAIISKIFMPLAIFPASAALYHILDTAFLLTVQLILMAYYGIYPGWQLAFFPVSLILLALLSIGGALLLSPINVIYRDVGFATAGLTQLLMFFTPVLYPSKLVPKSLHWLQYANPLTPLIQLGRWSLVGGVTPELTAVITSGLWVVFLLSLGSYVFSRFEGELVEGL